MESVTTQKIFAAFVKAQAGFAPALKSSVNPHFRSKYADLAACVEAVIDSLNENGIGLIQKTHADDSGVTVETVFVHESGESFSAGILHVPASKQDAQGYGSALSYARRYGLMASCGIAPEDDDGNAAARAKHQQKDNRPEADDETAEFAEGKAMQVRTMFAKGDVSGAAEILNMLGTNGAYDAEAKELVWGRLESNIRSAIRAYEAISKATTLESLRKAWDAAPLHSKPLLEAVKDKRKTELSTTEKEAA